jgi:glutamate synthase (NADPH) small chain
MRKDAIKPKELEPQLRIKSFDEVVSKYTEEEALAEAKRCLQCKEPVCILGCPVGIDIKKFIYQITNKDYKGAYCTIREKNDFASICGRVCPAEYQCRKSCVLTKKGELFASESAIKIHFLERFVGDWAIESNIDCVTHHDKNLTKYKVAVVGAGPAGLCVAGELTSRGLDVALFEALHKTGGVLRYGIPSFRLPGNVLDHEVSNLEKLGVDIMLNCVVGKLKSIDELFKEGYSAVFLGLGAGAPSFLGVGGENLCNVYSANEFLTRVNLMGAGQFPKYHTPVNVGKNMVIIGGGNTAIDAARVALRLQTINNLKSSVTILYRRTEKEMPARRLEIEHAKEEGINFMFLRQPVEFLGDDQGAVTAIKTLECKLGEPDSSGRRRPVPIAGSEQTLDCDVAIVAVGLLANRLLTHATPELKVDEYGDITVNPETMATSIPGVFAGGDIVGGEGTVIEAMGMGKIAANAIIDYIEGKKKT